MKINPEKITEITIIDKDGKRHISKDVGWQLKTEGKIKKLTLILK